MILIITDDTNLEQAVALKMQQSLQLWHGLLQATGGDLVPEKCFWYLIDFKWANNRWQYVKWTANERVLSIPRSDGTKVQIPRLETGEARRTLGVRLAPDGNNDAEYAHLREEAIKWKNHIATANLPRAVADYSIRQVLLPKLRYPLVATTFSEAQCQGIMQPVLQQGLPALGVNRNFPRAVAHGPVAYQGLNLPNPHTEQLITHILTVLKYGNIPHDPTGSLIRACGELMRLEVGMHGPFFKLSPYLHVCMTETWLSHCWYSCVQRGIFIDTDIADFDLPRERDQIIMEGFLRTGYQDAELVTLNRCRMYLQVIFLSDICNGQGTTIETHFWSGTAISNSHDFRWPRTHKPNPSKWGLWQRALTRSFNLNNTRKLPLPLGKWDSITTQTNGWYTDEAGLQLFHQTEQEWTTFTPLPSRRRTRSFLDKATPTTLHAMPKPLYRATTYHHGNIGTITGYGPMKSEPINPTPDPFNQVWQRWQCESTLEGSVDNLIQAIQSGKAVAVSDGSFRDQMGAAAWTIEATTAEHQLLSTGHTPGNPEDQSAYRSELFGLWGILASLRQLSSDHNIHQGQVTIACDGLSALKKARVDWPTEPGEAHHDLISAIRNLRRHIPLKLIFEHVKGHQDQGLITALPRLAWMNIEMDALAKNKLLLATAHNQLEKIPFESWTCSIEGRRTIKHLPLALRRHLNGQIILNHWATRTWFSPKIADTIDWASAEGAMNGMPLAKRQWVSKLAARFLPDGKNMQRWGQRKTAKCPRCPCPEEDKEHIFKCKADSAIKQWTQALEQLDNWLEAAKTHPQLRHDIINGLRQWHDQTSGCRPLSVGSTAGTLQDHIGWGLALEGCIAKQWQEEQAQYWKAFKSRRSSRRWTIALLTRLMMTAWDMWNHRNKALHEQEENRSEILEAAVNQQIREVYEQGRQQLPPDAHTLMNRSLARLLRFPAAYKHQWLASVEAARARFSRSRGEHPRTIRRSMNKYLQRMVQRQ